MRRTIFHHRAGPPHSTTLAAKTTPMFSRFKDMTGKVAVNSSGWILDQEESEILKDITVSKAGETIQRIQVRYVLDNSLVDGEMDDGLKAVLGNSQHLAIIYAPPIGAGEGYLAFRITTMNSKITLFASVSTSDAAQHSVLAFQSENDVVKVLKLFATGEDVLFELMDMNSKPVVKFIVPNESGFENLRSKLRKHGS